MVQGFRHILAIAFGLIVLAGCEDKAARQQVADLKEELERLKRSSLEKLDSSVSQAENLKHRVEVAERKSEEAKTQVAAATAGAESRFQNLEKTITELVQMQQKRERMAFLSPNTPNATSIQTAFGVFLLRLEGLAWDSKTSRFVAKISLGNLVGLSIGEFTLKGDFGGGAPKLTPGEDYAEFNKRMESWEAGLTPFEHTVNVDVTPEGWTHFELPLSAKSEADLQLIRITMTVKKAFLPEQTESKSKEYTSIVVVGSNDTVRTKYGVFLVKFERVEPEGSGMRVHLAIGNPLGLNVTESVFIGKYGTRHPEKLPGETPEIFMKRKQEWTRTLKDFKATVSKRITAQRWTRVDFLIPEPNITEVQTLAFGLQLNELNLPVGH